MANQIKDDEFEDQKKKEHEQAKAALKTDLTDSPHDQERMQAEEITMDLPDVKDIPGQEHIHVPQIMEMQDVTIASDDEEGVGIFNDDEEDDDNVEITRGKSNVTKAEKEILSRRADDEPGDADSKLRRAELDNTDAQGTPLNEGSMATDISGGDLDTSGVDNDDAMEKIGEEDEENNLYSLGGDGNENLGNSKQ